MRRTITLDRDVEVLLKKAMRERGLSLNEALNLAVRIGLTCDPRPAARRVFRQESYRMGFPAQFRWHKALAISDAIEDDELVRKLQLRK